MQNYLILLCLFFCFYVANHESLRQKSVKQKTDSITMAAKSFESKVEVRLFNPKIFKAKQLSVPSCHHLAKKMSATIIEQLKALRSGTHHWQKIYQQKELECIQYRINLSVPELARFVAYNDMTNRQEQIALYYQLEQVLTKVFSQQVLSHLIYCHAGESSVDSCKSLTND